MELMYKKCEVCGTKINKLQSIWNVFLLKTGEGKMKCPNCNTNYKPYKLVRWFFAFYTWGFAWILPMLYIISFIFSIGEDLRWEAWVYAFILYTFIEFIVMLIIPLHIYKDDKNKE